MAAKKAKKRKNNKRKTTRTKPSAAQLAARKKLAAANKARAKAAKKKRAGASAKKPRAAVKRRRNKTVIVKPKRVLVINGKKRAAKKRATKKRRTRNTPVTQIRKEFAGRVNKITTHNVSDSSPRSLAKLGKLVLIKTEGGTIKPTNGTTWLCADSKGKLHLSTTAAQLHAGGKHNFGHVTQVEYEEQKPHLGYPKKTIFFHRMGEEGGNQPTLLADGKGGLVFRGGSYKIKREGIVN